MAQELVEKVEEILANLEKEPSPWAMSLIKTAQSKNIDIAEWNTFVLKIAQLAADVQYVVDALLAVSDRALTEVAQVAGESTTAVMSQKATTDAIADSVLKNVQDGPDLGVQQAPGSGVEDNAFSFEKKNPVATGIFEQMLEAGIVQGISLDKIPYGSVGESAVSFNSRSAAFGKRSFTNGTSTIAVGEHSHAEGDSTVTFGNGSHTEGYYTTAVGIESHAEGISTVAYGDGSHAEGDHTEAHGESSHAEGYCTKALDPVSHVSGRGTVSSRDAQTVVGTYNKGASNALFVVGNGTSDENPSNAFTVNDDGTATLGSSPKYAMDATNRKYVDDAIAEERSQIDKEIEVIWEDQAAQNEEAQDLNLRVKALEQGGGGPSVEVVQSTGTSTEAVMSQDAVTKQLNKKVSTITGDARYPVVYGITPTGYYGGGVLKGYKISDKNYAAPTDSLGAGALVQWYGYGDTGQICNQNAPKSFYDLSNKQYVDARSGYMTTVYWSNVQGGEYIVRDRGTAYNYPSNMIPNTEYCIGFCNSDGFFDDSIDPTSGQLRFNGTFDEVLLRGEGVKECIEISGKEDGYYPNGVIIKFTDTTLRGTYKILKFRELPCPCGPAVLIIEVIF